MLRGPAATPSVKNTCKLEASYIGGPRINYLHERNLQVSDRLAPGEMARKGGQKTTSTNLRAANKKKKKEKKRKASLLAGGLKRVRCTGEKPFGRSPKALTVVGEGR